MARTKETTKRSDLRAFSYKISLKNGDKFLDKPEFEIKERGADDKYVLLPERSDYVKGNITKIEPRESTFNGALTRDFSVTLEDPEVGEIYFLNVKFNGLGRSFANALLSLKTFDNVSVSLYASKPKMVGGKSFPSVSLRQNDERVTWRYRQDELPKADEVTFKGVVQRDWTKQEVFLSEQLKALNAQIRRTTSASAVETPLAELKSEDVPF